MLRHENKVALVTGAARGQGRAIAVQLAREGAVVAAVDMCAPAATSQYPGATRADLDETTRLIREAGGVCHPYVADVRDLDALTTVVADMTQEYGRLDICIANAGFVSWHPFLELAAEQWQEVVDINLTGTFNTFKAVLPPMIDQLDGRLVSIASVNAVEPAEAIGHYTAAKHGVLGLTRNIALEFGKYGVRANSVLPSAVNTTMGNNTTNAQFIFGRSEATEEEYLAATRQWHVLRNRPALKPKDVAGIVSWLASDEASVITGAMVPADGGHLILPGFNHNPIAG